MNILLVYPNVMGVHKVHLGLAYVSSFLKKAGHKISFLDTTFGVTEEKIVESCHNTDLVGVSVMTLQLEQTKWISKVLKEHYSVPILWGGNHPTVRPAECIDYSFVDMVCVGEGEEPVVELVERLEADKDITDIKNIWTKRNGRVYRNPPRPLAQDLDSFPYPDREIFDKRHLRIDSGSIVSGSRGCPYGCGYCINDNLKKLYKNSGKYLRHRSVDNLLDELEIMRNRYGVSFFEFADETFTLRKDWVLEFCEKYERKFKLPFIFQTRCDTISREVLEAIKKAGCNELSFAIESGNEKFRYEILQRKMSDEIIYNAFSTAKEVGFKVCSFNMVGMPCETERDIIDTIRINKKIKPHRHNVCIFYPFPGTRLGDLCIENSWVREGSVNLESYYYDSVLEMPQLKRLTILTYQKFFAIYLKLPAFLFPIVTPVFKLSVKIGYSVLRKTRSRLLREFLNNLYWINSALTSAKLMKKLIVTLPSRFTKILKEQKA